MKLFILITFILLSGCSNIEFVHYSSSPENILKNQTFIKVTGDDSTIIKKLLLKKFGKKIKENKYKLEVVSNKKISNLVINNNQAATHLEIEHNLNYTLYEINSKNKNCIILTDNKITKSDYIVKSEGYNFGSTTNKKAIIEKNIKKNLLNFFKLIKLNLKNLSC